MLFYPEERTALFIDGANLYATARSLDMEIDYKRLRTFFADKARLIRAFYYTAILEDAEYSPLRPLVDWLDYNGFTLVTKPVKEFTDEHGRRKIKGNMDIEIAVDMLNIAENVDHVVLFSGDGDFRRLLEAVQRRGVRVTVISSNSTQPSMIADELRRQADQFVDINQLKAEFGRSGGGPSPMRRAVGDRPDTRPDSRPDSRSDSRSTATDAGGRAMPRYGTPVGEAEADYEDYEEDIDEEDIDEEEYDDDEYEDDGRD